MLYNINNYVFRTNFTHAIKFRNPNLNIKTSKLSLKVDLKVLKDSLYAAPKDQTAIFTFNLNPVQCFSM